MDEPTKPMLKPSSKTGGLEGICALRREKLGGKVASGHHGRIPGSQDAFRAQKDTIRQVF